jgi:hypothetical protein
MTIVFIMLMTMKSREHHALSAEKAESCNKVKLAKSSKKRTAAKGSDRWRYRALV